MAEGLIRSLNQNSPSALSPRNRFLIDELGDETLEPERRKEIIQYLGQAVCRRMGVWEEAEVLTYCGYWSLQIFALEAAQKYLAQAVDIYHKMDDCHREAIALWYKFRTEQSLGHYGTAYQNADKARKYFEAFKALRAKQGNHAQAEWYDKQIIEIARAVMELPELMYECLFVFEGSRLSPSAARIKQTLQTEIEKRNFHDAYPLFRLLRSTTMRSLDNTESAEALAYCGVTASVMENKQEAQHCLSLSLAQYLPGSHQHAIVRWILATIQFNYPAERAKALSSMEQAVLDFERLRARAVAQNLPAQSGWYATHLMAMRAVLRNRTNHPLLPG